MSEPLLRADLAIVEQRYRDEQSFVVKDPTTHAYFRFRPVEIRVMRLFDGARSAAQIAEQLVADGVRVSAATVDGFARKLATLGLLERTLMERTTQQLERLRAERRRQRSLVRGELFRMRFSFGDPDDFLTRWYPRLRWCFTPAFVIVSVVLFLAYAAIVITQADALSRDFAASFSFGALTPWSVFVLLGMFSLLTAIHEFGHAFACKHYGGEVHEMGFMLLFFMPAFYANVNDAWSFPERKARLWVTAAGGWIELVVTAVFAITWAILSPGSVVGELAVASMMIGGIANVLTNFNPLLPLDGYFALGDWLEMPNIRQRARAHAAVWARKHLLREDVVVPELDPREHRILLAYGVSASVYVTGILLLLSVRAIGFFDRLLGATVAGVLVLGLLFALRGPLGAVVSAGRSAWHVARQRLGRGSIRRRWLLGTMALTAIAAVVPCNITANGPFTVVASSQVTVTAPASGVVSSVFVREGDAVAVGAPILLLRDFVLDREQVMREGLVDSLTSEGRRAEASLAGGAEAVQRINAEGASAAVAATRAQVGALRVVALVSGAVSTPRPEQLMGKQVQFGDTLLTLADVSRREIIIRLRGAGATQVRVGHDVRYIGLQNVSQALHGVVASVAPIAGDAGAVEARVMLSAESALRPGSTGEARVLWRQSTVLGALLWAMRSRVRNDLLL